MLDYISINEKSPILNQVSNNFKPGAILFHLYRTALLMSILLGVLLFFNGILYNKKGREKQ
ncbi:hypothetical protein WAK64_16095 [Bacillus spongiae]|uniref:Uncharacterized protein n=1 Tax=Bacillus spongiae TaxID=2683610 RepID=A0ABU8HHH1_9BACI